MNKYKNITITGDIFQYLESGDAMIQSLNCFRVMGAGLALQTKLKYPIIYEIDKNRNSFLKHNMLRESWIYLDPSGKIFIQSYMQFKPGRCNPSRQMGYIKDGLLNACKLLIDMDFCGTLYIPQIGCGIAGGDWNKISNLIYDTITNNYPLIDFKFVTYGQHPNKYKESQKLF